MFLSLRVVFVLVAFTFASVTAFTAQTTWFHTGVAPGACGQMHYDNEYVVALAFGTFDNYPGAKADDPNHNPICNKTLKATYEGKSVVVMVVDRCADCYQAENIDLSPTAFKVLADESKGRLFGVEWDWTELPVGPVGGGQDPPGPPTTKQTTTPSPNEPASGEQRRSRVYRRIAPTPTPPIARAASAPPKRAEPDETTKPSPGHKFALREERRTRDGRSIVDAPGSTTVATPVSVRSGPTRGRMERRRVNRPIVTREAGEPPSVDSTAR